MAKPVSRSFKVAEYVLASNLALINSPIPPLEQNKLFAHLAGSSIGIGARAPTLRELIQVPYSSIKSATFVLRLNLASVL